MRIRSMSIFLGVCALALMTVGAQQASAQSQNAEKPVLSPRTTWADPAAYDAQARTLAEMFAKNFEQFADGVDASVRSAGPRA